MLRKPEFPASWEPRARRGFLFPASLTLPLFLFRCRFLGAAAQCALESFFRLFLLGVLVGVARLIGSARLPRRLPFLGRHVDLNIPDVPRLLFRDPPRHGAGERD